MYFNYLEEREGLQSIQSEIGFMTYRIEENRLFLSDTYIAESRKTGAATKLMNILFSTAKDLQKQFVVCQVDVTANNPHIPMIALLGYGFKVYDILEGNMITFYKEVE